MLVVGCISVLGSDSCIHLHFLNSFYIPCSWQLILITIKMAPHGSSICFFSPLSSFSPDPAPFIILMQQKWKKKNSRSHFINCCCVPKHISSLKHLDIFVIEHFSSLLVKYAAQFVYVCACAWETYKVCVSVFAPVNLTDIFCAWEWCTI